MRTNGRRKICVVLVDRANYGRLKPVFTSIQAHRDLELQVVAAGTMVLSRFGYPADLVRRDGFVVDREVFIELEGSTPTTMAKSVGFGVLEFAGEFQRLKPDVVLLIGDRYEALAAAIAAAYMNICVAHIQGGEVSGSIDESARHAISKFAHYHFPSTRQAARYLIRMGEAPATILCIGCPSSDIARGLDRQIDPHAVNAIGSGALIDLARPFLLVIYHPTTTEYGREQKQMQELLRALERLHMQAVMLWPNIDAGSDQISKAIRIFRDQTAPEWLRTITNVQPEDYLRILANTACAVGNSSSFVRDAGYFGTPVVLVGDRQHGREFGEHVTPVQVKAADVVAAVRRQLQHGAWAPSTLYGDGHVSGRIADGLAHLTPYTQKWLHYIYESPAWAGTDGRAYLGSSDGSRGLEGDPDEEHRPVGRTAVVGIHR
jgi:UDP-hydrolysing UDP-N-acetyl-D-glucosamine 2-epimerase